MRLSGGARPRFDSNSATVRSDGVATQDRCETRRDGQMRWWHENWETPNGHVRRAGHIRRSWSYETVTWNGHGKRWCDTFMWHGNVIWSCDMVMWYGHTRRSFETVLWDGHRRHWDVYVIVMWDGHGKRWCDTFMWHGNVRLLCEMVIWYGHVIWSH